VRRVTEPDRLQATRAAYDTVTADYARMIRDSLADSPADRAVLGLFAELVDGPVADIGCGPGRITAHLASLGVDAAGVDLSPAMVHLARNAYPGLRFDVASMTALPLADASLGGLLAWYSLIHVPPRQHPAVLTEFARVLRHGGRLVLAFQVGDERRHITQAYGHDGLDLDAYRLDPAQVSAALAAAGLPAHATLVRQPEGPEKTPQAYILARKTTPG